MNIRIIVFFLLTGLASESSGQQIKSKIKNEIHVDEKGIIRLANGNPASYFGVNYTLPFAYGYRSHKKLGIDIEKAIDQDVYHMARLGINAFRVHIWDTEISDSLGNLKQNEHLRLFDYLVAKLEARNIRIIVTPVAFWGNGYPDKDELTGSFVEKYGKSDAVVNEHAFRAQERYLGQFFKHINPYTKQTYTTDPFIIATEINNEPRHSGPQKLATTYINRMMKAIRQAGWTKPVFYNISESPDYATAVANSNVNGFSFQWYPTGLVSEHEQRGNLLPNVDRYIIPFDTIPAFKNKAKIIYEFDAGDVLQPYMYPAMARSFKAAGFQWATQFAYDPIGTAFANTEYQTHYLNLAYTPAKAISLMIAARVFRDVPLNKSYGTFPADTLFGPFTVSYLRQTSEMNDHEEFYYANSTSTQPLDVEALKHIAGVGSSVLVKYDGKGAYFLDKLEEGSWRLEIMPDAIPASDPFKKTSLGKVVTQIVTAPHFMQINIPELGADFVVSALNIRNTYKVDVQHKGFVIEPGTYLVQTRNSSKQKKFSAGTRIGSIWLNEFEAPVTTVMNSTEKQTVTAINNSKLSGTQNSILLFNPAIDTTANIYVPAWKTDPYNFIDDKRGKRILKLAHMPSDDKVLGGAEFFIKDKLKEIETKLFTNVVIDAVSTIDMPAKIILIGNDGVAYSTIVNISAEPKSIIVPLSDFRPDEFVLLPRPYPAFQAFSFSGIRSHVVEKISSFLPRLEKIQIMLKGDAMKEFSVELSAIFLTK